MKCGRASARQGPPGDVLSVGLSPGQGEGINAALLRRIPLYARSASVSALPDVSRF